MTATRTSGTRARSNWVSGQEEYAKGWIECFYAYMGLAPAETHWTLEKFQKYSVDDYEKDVFVDGHVDMSILQSTYLKQWYTTGFNTIEQERGAARALRGPGDPQRRASTRVTARPACASSRRTTRSTA